MTTPRRAGQSASCTQSASAACSALPSRTLLVASLTFLLLTWWSEVAAGRRLMERKTKYGRVKGVVEMVQGDKRVEKYLGIPYARPPLGNLRFEVSQCGV